jgi:sugar-specific transcriptional regulator TrmB
MVLNDKQNLIQGLREVGLTANEAKIYISLLSIGTNPASIVAKNAKINRSACYTTLINLAQKGFAERTIKENTTYFTAIDPYFLLTQLKNKHEELEHQIKNLNGTLEKFQQIKNTYFKKPKVVFFEGEKGVKNIMESTLMTKDIIRAYACLDGLTHMLPNYFPDYYKRRTAKGIKVKAIYPASILSYLHKLNDNKELRESKLIPSEYNFHFDFLIFDSTVAITSIKENFGLIINSEDLADAQKKIFDLIWENTITYDKLITREMERLLKQKKCKSPGTCTCCN